MSPTAVLHILDCTTAPHVVVIRLCQLFLNKVVVDVKKQKVIGSSLTMKYSRHQSRENETSQISLD